MTAVSRPLFLVFGLVLAVCGSAAPSLAQNAPAPGAPAPKSGLDLLPERDVRAIQDALIWTGDYSGVVNGSLGTHTRDAIAAYLKRTESAGGNLDAGARTRLLAEAQAKRQAVGFGPVVDKRTGLSLGLPMKMLVKETGTESGTRFSSADGAIVVDTLARPVSAAGLPDLFARMSAAAGTRKVSYKLLRPDFFVVSGETGDRSFYSRFAQGNAAGADTVRGFTESYPKAAAARLDPISLAIAASFEPFPATPPVPAASVMPPPRPAAANPNPAPAGTTGTVAEAVLVGPGLVLSRVSSKTCASPQIDGAGVRYRLEDDRTGLALLTAPGNSPPVPVTQGPVREGDSLFGLFHGAASGPGKAGPLMASPAEVRQGAGPEQAGFTVSAPFQARSAAPPLFDRSGALVGMAERNDKPRPTVAGTMPQASYRVTGAAEIKSLLDRAGVAGIAPEPDRDRGLGALVSVLKPSVLAVTCL